MAAPGSLSEYMMQVSGSTAALLFLHRVFRMPPGASRQRAADAFRQHGTRPLDGLRGPSVVDPDSTLDAGPRVGSQPPIGPVGLRRMRRRMGRYAGEVPNEGRRTRARHAVGPVRRPTLDPDRSPKEQGCGCDKEHRRASRPQGVQARRTGMCMSLEHVLDYLHPLGAYMRSLCSTNFPMKECWDLIYDALHGTSTDLNWVAGSNHSAKSDVFGTTPGATRAIGVCVCRIQGSCGHC